MKKVHVVFPRMANAKEMIINFFKENIDYQLINYDEDINTFRHYMMKEDLSEVPQIALLVIVESIDVPIEIQIKEVIEKAREVKLNHVNLRMVFAFPPSFKQYPKLVKDLVSVGIYDIHFIDEFGFDHMLEWLNTEKSLADVKHFIQIQTDSESIAPVQVNVNEPGKTNEEHKDEEINNDKITRLKKSSSSSVKPKTEVITEVVTNTIEQKNIAILSFTKCAGATFHATNLAEHISSSGVSVGVYEYPKKSPNKTYMTDIFDFFMVFDEEVPKKSIPHLIAKGEEFNVNENVHVKNHIHFYPVNYLEGNIEEFSLKHLMKYLNVGRHVIKIMDCGNFTKEDMLTEEFTDVLSMFDVVLVIIDMMPISILSNYEKLLSLKKIAENLDVELLYMVNNFTDSIKKEHLNSLEIGTPEKCPSFERDKVFKAMYEKKALYEYDKYAREELQTLYEKILSRCGITINANNSSKSKYKKRLNIFGLL